MDSQPVYVTDVNPAGGSVDVPPRQYPGPGGQLANPPPPQYPGPGVHLANPPPPRYPGAGAHVGNAPAPRYPGLGTSGGYPSPPPYPGLRVQNADPPNLDGDGGGPGATADNKHRGEARSTAARHESRKRKWAMFLVGNLIFVATIVFEIAELKAYVAENTSDNDDTPQENYFNTPYYLMGVWIFGLLVDVFSAIVLSAIYGSPLDIKSVHKIPPGDMRHCGGTATINFLSPFWWFLVYFLGGLESLIQSDYSPRGGGVGGTGLVVYLYVSGLLMYFVSIVMLLLSIIMLLVACCSSLEVHRAGASARGCCTRARDSLHKRVISTNPMFDLGWQLQGVILSYRVGLFNLTTAVLVGLSGVLGEVLAAVGSYAPEEVQEQVGPEVQELVGHVVA